MMAALFAWPKAAGSTAPWWSRRPLLRDNYTKPLLFLSGGTYFEERAEAQHLLGTQWGMMNETGSYPGQVWLWLYTFWYQIEPFKSSENADLLVFLIMGVLSLASICVPFIPGLRSLPRHLRVYRADLARPLPRSRGLSRSRSPGQLAHQQDRGGNH